MIDPTDQLLEELAAVEAFPLFITGAGISVASGIPTFRGNDPDAVWANDVLEKGTVAFFHKNPVESWLWYLARFDKARTAEPNAAHRAMAEIESQFSNSGRRFLTVTQNVDGLHLAAGSQNVIECHGAARKVRCSNRRCVNGEPEGFFDWQERDFAEFRANPKHKTLPRCRVCRKILRAHVLWFDEAYTGHTDYCIDDMFDQLEHTTVMVYVGTSLAVNVTMMTTTSAYQRSVPQFLVDPHINDVPEGFIHIKEPSETWLPKVAAALKEAGT